MHRDEVRGSLPFADGSTMQSCKGDFLGHLPIPEFVNIKMFLQVAVWVVFLLQQFTSQLSLHHSLKLYILSREQCLDLLKQTHRLIYSWVFIKNAGFIRSI